jgi:hypothetical protein
MKKPRYNEEEIALPCQQAECGTRVAAACREMGVS